MARSLDALLPPADQARVVEAVARAEHGTSGQIKVHVEARCKGDPLARATALFGRLGLTRTRARNGVLVYVAVTDRKLAIVGDQGIHQAAGGGFWDEAAARMRAAFARGAIGDGLCEAVASVGAKLAAEFPHHDGDPNELSDDISTEAT